MNELKKLLSQAYSLEEDLIEFIEECFKRIYGEESERAFQQFKEDVEFSHHYNGCLHSLSRYDSEVKEWKENRKRYYEGFKQE